MKKVLFVVTVSTMMVVFSLIILSMNSFTSLEKDLKDFTYDSISKSIMSLFMKD